MLERCERKILLGWRLLELLNRVMVATVLAAALLLLAPAWNLKWFSTYGLPPSLHCVDWLASG